MASMERSSRYAGSVMQCCAGAQALAGYACGTLMGYFGLVAKEPMRKALAGWEPQFGVTYTM